MERWQGRELKADLSDWTMTMAYDPSPWPCIPVFRMKPLESPNGPEKYSA